VRKLYSVLYGDFYPFVSLLAHVEHPDREDDGFNAVNNADLIRVTSPTEVVDPDSALIVWGGADIHPDLYKRKRSMRSGAGNYPSPRDIIEWSCMDKAIELGIPIIGICRGAQMLCAKAGGYLYQDTRGHAGQDHRMVTPDGTEYIVNSLHHQMLAPWDVEHKLLGWSPEKISPYYDDEGKMVDAPCEPELVVFPKIKGIAAQWHPEMMGPDAKATELLLKTIKEVAGG
jgi:anthranilate/para-aminobenzoate synthase component II